MLTTTCRSGLLVALLAMTPIAWPAVIGFEAAPPGGQILGNGYTESGYTFTIPGPNAILDGAFGGGVNTNGTDILAWCANDCGPSSVIVTGPAAFNLLSIDIAAMTSNVTAGMSVNLTGLFSGGGSIFTSLPVTITWTTHPVVGFVNLASLQIVAIDPTAGGTLYDSAIDNLNVTEAIPEPSALILLGTGLLGLWAYHRRNRVS